MWDTDQPYPEPDGSLVDEPVGLGFAPDTGTGLKFEPVVTRTHTEWDSHYVRFAYRHIWFVAELNIDGMPYVDVQHDRPCQGLGLNEQVRKNFHVTCAQTGREESVSSNRRFSLDSETGPVVLWDTYRQIPLYEARVRFGKALLGLGLDEDLYLQAATDVTEGLRNFIFNPAAPWWPVWSAREH